MICDNCRHVHEEHVDGRCPEAGGRECYEYTRDIVCPRCLTEFPDWWEWGLKEDEAVVVDCGHCGRKFYAELHVSYTFTTRVHDPGLEAAEEAAREAECAARLERARALGTRVYVPSGLPGCVKTIHATGYVTVTLSSGVEVFEDPYNLR